MTHQKITGFRVANLFGYISHDIELRADAPTLITGPNGSGKTHILKLLAALAGLDILDLMAVRFDEVELRFANALSLVAEQIELEGDTGIVLKGLRQGTTLGTAEISQAADLPPLRAQNIPPWIQRVGARNWYDSQTEETITSQELRQRYFHHSLRDETVNNHAWLQRFVFKTAPTFIRTGRLDIERAPQARREGYPPAESRAAPIQRYVRQLRQQIDGALGASLTVTQRADRRFAARALDRARATVNESTLRRRYQALADIHHQLHENGLTEETIEVTLPTQKMNPTERRILDVFLEDWEAKLRPLLPVQEKLQLLREIVESKIQDKRLIIPHEGDLHFISASGDVIGVELLSSGEQHMLALFTMFLFAPKGESLVLIDEPEISLHAAWKHAFLDDLQRVGQLIPMQVVMATHSTALINSRWDLVEELNQ
jgi:predicted ATPase